MLNNNTMFNSILMAHIASISKCDVMQVYSWTVVDFPWIRCYYSNWNECEVLAGNADFFLTFWMIMSTSMWQLYCNKWHCQNFWWLFFISLCNNICIRICHNACVRSVLCVTVGNVMSFMVFSVGLLKVYVYARVE